MSSTSNRWNVLAAACLASCVALWLAAPATADFEPAPPRSLSVTKPAAGDPLRMIALLSGMPLGDALQDERDRAAPIAENARLTPPVWTRET